MAEQKSGHRRKGETDAQMMARGPRPAWDSATLPDPRWEYVVRAVFAAEALQMTQATLDRLRGDVERELNAAAQDGWRLVQVIPMGTFALLVLAR